MTAHYTMSNMLTLTVNKLLVYQPISVVMMLTKSSHESTWFYPAPITILAYYTAIKDLKRYLEEDSNWMR